MGDVPGVSLARTNTPQNVSIVSPQQASVNNDITIFNQGSGGGNQSSGGNQGKSAMGLATVLLGTQGNDKSIPALASKLAGLSKALENAGIKSANISLVDGKLEITELSKEDGSDPYSSLSSFMSNRISMSLSPAQSEVSAQLILSIMKMASEARSEIIKMIIEAMEKNHQQWLEVLKQMAIKSAEKKDEAKVVLKNMLTKLMAGDIEGAKALLAEFSTLVGISFSLPKESVLEELKSFLNKSENIAYVDKYLNDLDSSINQSSISNNLVARKTDDYSRYLINIETVEF